MDEEARRLRRIGNIKTIDFWRRRNEIILPSDLALAGMGFHTVGAATEKVRVTALVFTRGMKSWLLLVERSCLECLAGVSIEFIYAGCVGDST